MDIVDAGEGWTADWSYGLRKEGNKFKVEVVIEFLLLNALP